MYKNKKILAVITARGGSKGVPRKNIKPLAGRPLISYVIRAALASKYLDSVIVSTEDKEIADVSKKYGAEVPFMRPIELAGDNAKSLDALQHATIEMGRLGFKADYIVLIQPTTPLALPEDIDAAIVNMIDRRANSCTTVSEIVERPEAMYSLKKFTATAYVKNRNQELRRQDLPPLYISNGAAFAVKRETLLKQNTIVDEKNHTVAIMPRERSVDINDHLDFKITEAIIKADIPNGKNKNSK